MHCRDSMGVTRTQQWARSTRDLTLCKRFGTGTGVIRWHHTNTHTHTRTHADTHKRTLLSLPHFTNKNSILQVAFGPTQICTQSCFPVFFCASTKQVPRLATSNYSSNLFPPVYALTPTPWITPPQCHHPSFKVHNKYWLAHISKNPAHQKSTLKCPHFVRQWCCAVPYCTEIDTAWPHSMATPMHQYQHPVQYDQKASAQVKATKRKVLTSFNGF